MRFRRITRANRNKRSSNCSAKPITWVLGGGANRLAHFDGTFAPYTSPQELSSVEDFAERVGTSIVRRQLSRKSPPAGRLLRAHQAASE